MPDEVRTILGMGEGQKMVLISFSDLTLEPSAQQRLEKMREVLFLYKKPLHFSFANSCCVENPSLSYADLVATVDGVVTKPGYGIVADCLSHGTPMIYTDRGPFPEYEILVRTMTEHLPVVFLPSGDLYAGSWETAIGQLPDKPGCRPQIRLDGGRVCAETILAHLGWL
jgi:hypothetical protein